MVSYNKEVGVVKVPMTPESFGKGGHRTGTTYTEGRGYIREMIFTICLRCVPSNMRQEHLAYSTSSRRPGLGLWWNTDGRGGFFTNHPGVVDFKVILFYFIIQESYPAAAHSIVQYALQSLNSTKTAQ